MKRQQNKPLTVSGSRETAFVVLNSARRNSDSLYLVSFALFFALVSCNPRSENSKPSSTKFDQYYVQGEQLYIRNCSNCHQRNGTGLGLLYPPLKESDYLLNNFDQVICLIRTGIRGELTVNGKSFNQPMPGIPSLTDLEIAEIATYVYNTWGNNRGITDVQEVTKVLSECNVNLPAAD